MFSDCSKFLSKNILQLLQLALLRIEYDVINNDVDLVLLKQWIAHVSFITYQLDEFD